ncbi:MAG TPA: hypothetical protein VHM70_30545 [Polyangiaceae bacterium]|nr:hypothetical protein [Polyangiaceae bacterium]
MARYRECKQLAVTANPVLAEIAGLDSTDENTPAPDNYQLIADRYRRLDKDLEPIEGKASQDLKAVISGIRSNLRATAREVDRYRELLVGRAKSGEENNQPQVDSADANLKSARERVAKTVRAYSTSVDRVASLCTPQG